MWRFLVHNDRGGNASWWLYAGNNELVAWAGESFVSLHNAHRAAEGFKAASRVARYEVYADASGAWRWRAWHGSRKVAASGQSFSSRYAAQAAADLVRTNAATASSAAA